MLPDPLEVWDNEALWETLHTHTPPPLLSEEMTHYAVSGRESRKECLSLGWAAWKRQGWLGISDAYCYDGNSGCRAVRLGARVEMLLDLASY